MFYLDEFLGAAGRPTSRVSHGGPCGKWAITVLVIVGLALVNISIASEFLWVLFVALGMSIGVWFDWYFGVQHGEETMRRHHDEIERAAERHRIAA